MTVVRMVATKRALALPLILAAAVSNVLYGVYLSFSPSLSAKSSTTTAGIHDIQQQRLHRANAIKQFAQEQESQDQSGQRKLHLQHKQGYPSLVIHVGPHHTQAEELQSELTALRSELDSDKYFLLLGNTTLGSQLTDIACHRELTLARRKYGVKRKKGAIKSKVTLKEYLSTQVPCWKRVLEALDEHRTKGHSLVISDESISSRWYHSFDGLDLTPMDWIAMEETLSDQWNVDIVVGYRRYAEWLPEALRVAAETRHENALREGNPPPKRVDTGVLLKPLFPDIVESATGDGVAMGANIMNATYTATLVQRYLYRGQGEAKIPITLLNVHKDDTLGTTFTCQILYAAPTACRASHKKTASLARDAADAVKKRDRDPVQSKDFYELLAQHCAAHNMYRTQQYSIQVAALSLRFYQEEILQKGPAEMILKCPTPEQLQMLLDISLKHERNLLPSFAKSHEGEDEHRRSFMETAEDSRKFCTVYLTKMMNDAGMRAFAQALPKGVPEELLPGGKKKEVPAEPLTNEHPVIEAHDVVSKKRHIKGRVTTIRHWHQKGIIVHQ
jgi:hypothetical protein